MTHSFPPRLSSDLGEERPVCFEDARLYIGEAEVAHVASLSSLRPHFLRRKLSAPGAPANNCLNGGALRASLTSCGLMPICARSASHPPSVPWPNRTAPYRVEIGRAHV